MLSSYIFIGFIRTTVIVVGLVYQTDAHPACLFKRCFNVAQPEGHIHLLAYTVQIEL